MVGVNFQSLIMVLSMCELAVSVNPVVVAGNMLFDAGTKERFFLKGVTYGYSVEDKDKRYWEPALKLLVDTIPNLNTIRVYNINPTIHSPPFDQDTSYDEFMRAAEAYGIYVTVSVTPNGSPPWSYCVLNRDGTPPLSEQTCYPSCLLTYGQAIVNQFSKYRNTLAFVVGNEVINSVKSWNAAPCVKQYAADLKAYMRGCRAGMRVIPLMYAAADNAYNNTVDANTNDRWKADYLTCGDEATTIDIFGMNIYRWCNNKCTFSSCAYKSLHDALKHSYRPLMLAEFGCADFYYDGSTKGQRDWKQVPTILGADMAPSWSGGTAYGYGVEGGAGFALFTGGGVSPTGNPGYTKSCGYPGDVCNADNLATQYKNSDGPKTPVDGDNVCNWVPKGYVKAVPMCPPIPNVDLSLPDTRQDAPGYSSVTCVTYPLSPIEQQINSCYDASSSSSSSSTGESSSSSSSDDSSSSSIPYSSSTGGPGPTDPPKGNSLTIVLAVGGSLLLLGAFAGCYFYFRRHNNRSAYEEIPDA